MKMQFVDKVWRILFILIFVLGTVWMPATSAQAEGAEYIGVSLSENTIQGFGWPQDVTVDVSVDDPATPLVDYSGNAQVEIPEWSPTETWFQLEVEDYDLKAGDVVTVTYQAISKQLTIASVEITNVDSDENIVTGTAAASSAIDVWVCGQINCSETRVLSADANGDWSTDFDDAPFFDIRTGARVTVRQSDSNGDTVLSWDVPNPTMDVWFEEGSISAYGWPLDTILTLTIGDPASPDYTTTTQVTTAPWDHTQTLGQFNIGDFTILPGMTLTVSGATFTKELVIADLTITSIDAGTEVITGSAGINQSMWMYYNSETGTCCRDFESDASGIWTVDYSVPGSNGEPTENIGPGSSGTINARDDDEDNTSLSWYVSNPNFEVNARIDEVTAREWAEGSTINLTIEGVSYGSTTMGPAPWNQNDIVGQFDLSGVYDIQSGDEVIVEGSGITKVLTVTPIQVTNVNAAANTISGVASSGASLFICADTPTGCFGLDATANPDGAWSADFGTEFTLTPGWGGWVEEWDADGDGSWDNWDLPNPRIEGRTNNESVDGFEWPLGATVTLTINDPAIPGTANYTDTGTVVTAEWNSNETYFNINFNGAYDLKPGDIITVTDGTTTKQHTVTSLTITYVNPATNVVTGTAAANSQLTIWACDGDNCPTREVNVDGTGHWSTDFGDTSQPTLDIQPGTWVDAGQWDDENDGTLFGLDAPNPQIVGNAENDWIDAREWDEGATVTLSINDVPYGSAVVNEPQPWNPSWDYVRFNLADGELHVGDVITMSGDGITKELTISPLQVTGFDLVTDTISGVTTPNVEVGGGACVPDVDCFDRSATADGTGAWSLDYHTDLNLVRGAFGWVQEGDADGDATEVGWDIPLCFTLTTAVSLAGTGSVAVDTAPNCDGTQYTEGTQVQLTASPSTGYDFGSWSGAASGSANPVTITMEANLSVTANFTLKKNWFIRGMGAIAYGFGTDTPVVGDYNGDGKDDIAVFRPSNSTWYIKGMGATVYGLSTDIPVVGDYNGDGKDDIALYRPSNGTWYVKGMGATVWGILDDVPVVGDYNGDGKDDIAVYRPSNGTWYIKGMGATVYGLSTDIPVVGDYNGDGKDDIAVYRPSNGTWYVKGMGATVYGLSTDTPVVGDYNGDGKNDFAVYRPSNGTWYVKGMGATVYGLSTDRPVVGDYNGDGKDDIAVFRP